MLLLLSASAAFIAPMAIDSALCKTSTLLKRSMSRKENVKKPGKIHMKTVVETNATATNRQWLFVGSEYFFGRSVCLRMATALRLPAVAFARLREARFRPGEGQPYL